MPKYVLSFPFEFWGFLLSFGYFSLIFFVKSQNQNLPYPYGLCLYLSPWPPMITYFTYVKRPTPTEWQLYFFFVKCDWCDGLQVTVKNVSYAMRMGQSSWPGIRKPKFLTSSPSQFPEITTSSQRLRILKHLWGEKNSHTQQKTRTLFSVLSSAVLTKYAE